MTTKIDSIKQIGCYAIGNKLGEGAFAVVKSARHIITDMEVAIKLFDKEAVAQRESYIG